MKNFIKINRALAAKKKKILFFAAVLLGISNAFAVVTWDGTTKTAWTEGEGTEADPFIISSPNHLAYLAQQVNAGNTYAGNYFKQTEDFNLNSKTWTSIGTTSNKFAGNYDGGEKKISNFKNGLFGYIENASLKNLTIDGTYSGSGSSMFVSNTNGATKISNCHNKSASSGSISAEYFGCIVGKAEGTSITLENCSNQGTVNVTGSSNTTSGTTTTLFMGGIIGSSATTTTTTTLKNCYNSGSIKMSRSVYNNGYTTYSYILYVGGLIGGVSGNTTIDQCYNAGTVTALGSGDGGGKVDTYVAGLVNASSGFSGNIVITRSYNTGDLTSTGAGNNWVSLPYAYVFALGSNAKHTACYVANCTMKATGNIARTYFGGGSFESCYCAGNQAIEGLSGSNVYSNSSSVIGTAKYKSEEALKAPSMIPLLNTLDEYFTMDYEGVNNGYPILKWQEGSRHNIVTICDGNRGSVSGGGEYPMGHEVTLEATPKNNCTFVGWSDGNTDNPRTVTVSGDATYIALFSKSSYTIYVNQDCTGNIE